MCLVLLNAQYVNLVDRMVQNHDIRSITKDPTARAIVSAAFYAALLECVDTLSEITWPPARAVQAENVRRRLVDIHTGPYDGQVFATACRTLATLFH